MTIQFSDLLHDKNLLAALRSAGYIEPTPIQVQALPAAIDGRDIMASAQTGSGKTAAFLLPSLQRITRRSDKSGKGPRILVLTPTRELAAQVEKNAKIYAQNMLDMGFIDDIETIVAATPESRQTLLFSATWDGAVGKLARRLTKNPEVIEIEREDNQGKIDEQLFYCDDKNHKNRLLDHILRDANIDQCIIFTSTKAMSEQLADELYEKGFAANCLHGDMPQNWRNRTLMDLRKGRIKVLVATDVAARGIDVPSITHVINYDLPKQAEDYVHRIGRTGRAGRHGLALTFAEVNEYVAVHKIEKYLGRKLPEFTIEGMEPTRKRSKAPRKTKGGGWKQKGGRKPNGSGKPFGRPAGNPRGKARKPAAQGRCA